MSGVGYFKNYDHVTVIDQYIIDRYKYLTDKEIAYQLGITEGHVAARRMVLNLIKGQGWMPLGYKAKEPNRKKKDYKVVSIDEQIFALEMYAQSRPEGSIWGDIAREHIKHLKLVKLRA